MRPNKDAIYNQSKEKIKEFVLMRLADGDQPPYIETVALRYGIPRHQAARILTEIKQEVGYDKRTKNRSY
jgi:hypothetical protein